MLLHVRFLQRVVLAGCCLVVAAGVGAWPAAADDPPAVRVVAGGRFMVVSDSPHAGRVGAEVLDRGGNAVDAAVAVGFALAVTWPEAGNIGGGGFMLVHPGDGADPENRPVCIDYRETAPLAATEEMYALDENPNTVRMAGVPGTVRGLAAAHARYGKLPWPRLVRPAARLARDGFEIDRHLADSLNGVLNEPAVRTEAAYAELRRVYGRPEGGRWQAGDRLRLPELARTLEMLAEQGADAFYRGAPAEWIVREMERGEGLITARDLELYTAEFREPVRGEYRGYEVLGPPPPSSGGICLVQTLNILAEFPAAEHERQSPEMLHRMAEALRRSFRDRAAYLGDADFVEIPDRLTSPDYAARLARRIDPRRATPSEELAGAIELAAGGGSTTHYSIVDADGMAVANTYTLEAAWGSRIVVRGGGFLLNNEMGDFNRRRGRTTAAGHIGTEANLIEPRKRMLSSMTPAILCRDGRPVLVTGSPGGRTIISTVLCTIVNHVDYAMSPEENILAARMHHGWFPDELVWEAAGRPAAAETRARLEAMGHTVVPLRSARGQGSAHSIWIDPETGLRRGVADFRRGGLAVGK